MKIGISGHQSRPGIDWQWVRDTIRREIHLLHGIDAAYSSLAVGSDQVFAEVVLDAAIELFTVIPNAAYEENYKDPEALLLYKSTLAKSRQIVLPYNDNNQESFLVAGQVVSDSSDLLFAVWDEQVAAGKGGTADIVKMRIDRQQPVLCLNPIKETVKRI